LFNNIIPNFNNNSNNNNNLLTLNSMLPLMCLLKPGIMQFIILFVCVCLHKVNRTSSIIRYLNTLFTFTRHFLSLRPKAWSNSYFLDQTVPCVRFVPHKNLSLLPNAITFEEIICSLHALSMFKPVHQLFKYLPLLDVCTSYKCTV